MHLIRVELANGDAGRGKTAAIEAADNGHQDANMFTAIMTEKQH